MWMAFLILTEKCVSSPLLSGRSKGRTGLHITPKDEKEQCKACALRNPSSLLFFYVSFLLFYFCVLLLRTFLPGVLLAS